MATDGDVQLECTCDSAKCEALVSKVWGLLSPPHSALRIPGLLGSKTRRMKLSQCFVNVCAPDRQ